LDGKDLDIELDSTADSEKEDSEEEEDDDPLSKNNSVLAVCHIPP
jgi:hypothetical protein